MDATTGRGREASTGVQHARLVPTKDSGRRSDQARLARCSAQILMFGAGFVTVMNAASPLHGVDTGALRITGVITVVASLLLIKLPWERHGRMVSYGVVTASIGALSVSDSWHHYSRNDA